MRYSFAGGNDGLSQNVAAWSANYLFTDTMLPDLLHQSLTAMMAEKPPADGHRRAILDPHATHVGIGLAWDGGEFRVSQEFMRRYIEWKPMPRRQARTDERVTIAGSATHGTAVQAVSVHYEPEPQPMSAIVANRLESYALPKDRIDYVPRRYVNGTFSFTVPFTRGPGVYTVVVWVRPEGSRDVVGASNISIRARAPEVASSARGAR
jgi:hypothetical protein